VIAERSETITQSKDPATARFSTRVARNFDSEPSTLKIPRNAPVVSRNSRILRLRGRFAK